MPGRPRLPVALVALAVVAAACSEPAPIDRLPSAAPTTTTTAPGSPGPVDEPEADPPPTTTTAPDPPFSGLMFERAEGEQLVDDAPSTTISGGVAGGPDRPWVLVGSRLDPDVLVERAAVWTSADPAAGGSWTGESVAPRDDSLPESINAVAASLEGWIAVGDVGLGASRIGAVWRIAPDATVSAVPTVGLEPGVDLSFAAVADVAGLGLAAVGTALVDGARTPAVWTSADGATWTRVALGIAEGERLDALTSVAAAPSGFVVGGTVVTAAGDRDAAVWVSDGGDWRRGSGAGLGGPFDQQVLGVGVLADRLVAVGATEIGTSSIPAAWVSDDGLAWTGPELAFSDIGDGRITSNGRGATGLVADSGVLYARSTSSFLAQVWRSTDGVRWDAVGDLSPLRPSGVGLGPLLASGTTVVATSDDPATFVLDGTAWADVDPGDAFTRPSGRSTTRAVAHADGTFVAVGTRALPPAGSSPASVLGIAWTSQDGASWTADQTTFAAGPVLDVDGGDGRGFVAVGREDPAGVVDRNATALAWRSDDGIRWDEIDLTPALPPGGSSLLQTVALTPTGFIAGGWVFVGDDVDGLLVTYDDGAPTATRFDVAGLGLSTLGDQEITAVCAAESGAMLAFASVETDNGELVRSFYRLVSQPQWQFVGTPDGSFESSRSQTVDRCRFGGDDQWIALGSRTDADGVDIDAAVWTSAGATEWTLVDQPGVLDGPGEQAATGAIRLQETWLVMGDDAAAGTPVATVWVQRPDGWEALEPPTGLEAAGPTRGGALATSGGLIVATGTDVGRAGLWYTPSGQLGGDSPF